VVTPLQADRMEAMLARLGMEEAWQHVVDGIREGFDMGIGGQPSASIVHPNHSSAEADPDFIDTYVEEEVSAKHYLGLFSQGELEAVVGPFISSPLGLVPKANSAKQWRLIQDLSYLHHIVGCLVLYFWW
jgi:hypothetical protein